MNWKKLIMALLAILLTLSSETSFTYGQTLPAVNDDGRGTQFSQLSTNYVQILELYYGNAIIESGSGYSIEYGYVPRYPHMIPLLVWKGKLNFGGSKANESHGASLKSNNLPPVTLRFPNCAYLPEGRYADVLITMDDIEVNLGENYNSSINSNTTLKVNIAGSSGHLSANSPRISYADPNYTAADKSTGCAVGEKIRVTMSIVETGTHTPISPAKYPSMLVTFFDLDVPDSTTKTSLTNTERWNGYYAEGIELLSGWQGAAVLPPAIGDIANRCLTEVQITAAGNTKIKGIGDYIMALREATNNAGPGDFDSLYSGFVASVAPQGFSFNWTGSITGGAKSKHSMGTIIGGQPVVNVRAMRSGQGSTVSHLGGRGTYSGDKFWYSNTHLMNSSAVYDYTPGEGFYVKSLKVDGAAQAVNKNGGSYTFTKLNKYPLPVREIRNGYVLNTRQSSSYDIEVEFAHLPEYEDEKKADKESVRLGSDEEITYIITSEEIWDDASPGTHKIHDGLANGLLKLVPGSVETHAEHGTCTIDKADDSGIDITFTSDDADTHKPVISVTYKAKVDWEAYFRSSETSIVNSIPGSSATVDVTSDIRITKKVTGKLRDTTKKFVIEATLSGLAASEEYVVTPIGGGELNNVTTGSRTGKGFRSDKDGKATLVFNMTGGQGAVISDLPVGSKYRLIEAASDHTPSYSLASDSSESVFIKSSDSKEHNWQELATEEETLDKKDGVVTVAFTNNRDTTTITGLVEHTDWMISSILLIAAAVFAACGIRRFRRGGDNNEAP